MADDPPSRPTGKNTAILRTKTLEKEALLEAKKLRTEAALKAQEISANKEIELARLKLEAEKLGLEKQRLQNEDHDGVRDDKTSYTRTIFAGSAVIIALVVTCIMVFAAFHYGQDFSFEGFGYGVSTKAKIHAGTDTDAKE